MLTATLTAAAGLLLWSAVLCVWLWWLHRRWHARTQRGLRSEVRREVEAALIAVALRKQGKRRG